jgi:putative glutamine amidotransferase
MSFTTRRLDLIVLVAAGLCSCRPCPQPSPLAAPQAPAAPLIGITGYVVEPGTQGDEGLGNFRITRTYRDAVSRAGGAPVHLVPVPSGEVDRLVDRLDGLVLAGGPDVDPALYGEAPHPSVKVLAPERQDFDLALAREALRRRMPLLGICLGSQEINVARGGSLVQDIPSEVAQSAGHSKLELGELRAGVHEVTFVAGTSLASFYDRPTIRVNSAHHQAVETLGEGLVVAARASDGVVEGFVLPDHPFLVGVQYHPEIQNDPPGLHDRLFAAFVAAAAEYGAGRASREHLCGDRGVGEDR